MGHPVYMKGSLLRFAYHQDKGGQDLCVYDKIRQAMSYLP